MRWSANTPKSPPGRPKATTPPRGVDAEGVSGAYKETDMAKWTAFPHDAADYSYDSATLKKNWARLHAGDAEPLPTDAKVLAAWALFHAGEFQKAAEAGLKAGGAGVTVANKAQAIYANYLESSEKVKFALF